MNNDDRLAPRDFPIPVSVRRPFGPAGDPALMPQNPSTAAPPAQVAPQIIYINNAPAPAPAPIPLQPAAPLAPPAQHIHHHHYTTPQATPRVSIRLPAAPSHSALGMASLALGIIACVICWMPFLGLAAVPIGAIGAVIGVLGVLISLLFRRSSASLPLAGIFICCLAAAISIASMKSLPYWRRQLEQVISAVRPLVSTQPHSAAPSPAPPAAVSVPHSSIFDFGNSATPPPPVPAVVAAHPAIVSHLNPTIAAARDQLDAAEKASDQRTMQTAEYQAAVYAAADARSRETSLRDNSPGSSDLVQAGQDMIKADNAVTELLTRAQASDPQVIAARQAMAAARSGTAQ